MSITVYKIQFSRTEGTFEVRRRGRRFLADSVFVSTTFFRFVDFASFGSVFRLCLLVALTASALFRLRRLAFRPEGEAETTLAPPPCQKLFVGVAFFQTYPQVTRFLSPRGLSRGAPTGAVKAGLR